MVLDESCQQSRSSLNKPESVMPSKQGKRKRQNKSTSSSNNGHSVSSPGNQVEDVEDMSTFHISNHEPASSAATSGESGISDIDYDARELHIDFPGPNNNPFDSMTKGQRWPSGLIEVTDRNKLAQLHLGERAFQDICELWEKGKDKGGGPRVFLNYKPKGVFDDEDYEEIQKEVEYAKEMRERDRLVKEMRKKSKHGGKKGDINDRRPSHHLHSHMPRSVVTEIPISSNKSEWEIMKGELLYTGTIERYADGDEWKVTQLIGLPDSKLAILGRNGHGQTIVEVYYTVPPFDIVFEKTFDFDFEDAWQFGASINETYLALGCDYEIGLLNMTDATYKREDIRGQIKWVDKRIQAMAASHNQFVIANDRDLALSFFDTSLVHVKTINIQEHVECILSLAWHKEKIFICTGYSGEAYAITLEGRTLFQFKLPEHFTVAIPAIVTVDCDNYLHLFWLVKTEESYRSVDFYYNIAEDKNVAEVKLDEKVQFMGCVNTTDSLKKIACARSVFMTDDGNIFVSDTVIDHSKTAGAVENCTASSRS